MTLNLASWQPKAGAVLVAVGGALKYISSTTSPALKTQLDVWGDTLMAIGGALVGFTARQNDVSSEQAGANNRIPADPSAPITVPAVPSPVIVQHTLASTAPVTATVAPSGLPFVSGYQVLPPNNAPLPPPPSLTP